MPAKNTYRTHSKGSYSHVYNKGVENRIIFQDDEDYKVFLNFLDEYLNPFDDSGKYKKTFIIKGRTFQGNPHLPKNFYGKVELIAYCLEPTHFHLLIYQAKHRSAEKFIRSICTRYAIYFNKKYKRSGSLFEGPYKSAAVSDPLDMMLLTRFFHSKSSGHELGNRSSYGDYLGIRNTAWLKVDVVLTHFENTSNQFFKGSQGYRNFVESYKPSDEDNKRLAKIILVSKAHEPEKSEPFEKSISHDPKTRDNAQDAQNIILKHKIPEIIVAAGIYLVLFAVGISNTLASSKNHPANLFNSTVAGIHNEKAESPTEPPTQVLSAEKKNEPDISEQIVADEGQITTPTQTQEAENSIQPETIAPEAINVEKIIIKIKDGSKSINVRQSPSIASEVIGEAFEGETFEIVSKVSGWYGIKLNDDTIGFVSSKYAQIE